MENKQNKNAHDAGNIMGVEKQGMPSLTRQYGSPLSLL